MIRNTSRRAFIGSAALLAVRPGFAVTPTQPGRIRLGLCSYSLFKSTVPELIASAKVLGVRFINIKPEAHLPIDSSPAKIAEVAKIFNDAGLEVVGTGATYLQKPDEGAIRK